MSRKNCLIGLAAVLVALLSASRSEAITQCANCACTMSCTALCTTATGTSTCGAIGICVGKPGCGGGGCLTAGQSEFVLKLLDKEPRQAEPEQGRAAARLTWRLTQYAEENGLGDVYTAGTRFERAGAARKLASPDLAFVSRGRRAATPDLVVQFAPANLANADATAAGWLGSGARAVLVLDSAARTVQVYRQGAPLQVLGADAVLDLPDLLPGWSLRVGELFQ
ncbi:MAG TPA: Uma2 family endonuclease [Thermoanaerobaculia bacterium]|nr:Uma2 family endonuclease [Thermoanaerobaculia bacterium]